MADSSKQGESRDRPPSRRKAGQDPAVYEQECLEQAQLAVIDLPARDQHIGDVRLEGGYPDTRIVMELKHGEHPSTSWRLWGEDGGPGPYGQPSPETLGQEIAVFAYEYAFAR